MSNFRKERIEKLLNELRYEVERGIMEREIEEEMYFEYVIPVSNIIPDGVVHLRFMTRPIARHTICGENQPKLTIVESKKPKG